MPNPRGFVKTGRIPREKAPHLLRGGALHEAAVEPDDVYRFAPFRLEPADIQRIHGKDERLASTSLANGVRFYRRLVQRAAAE